jgi:hypothetical protein
VRRIVPISIALVLAIGALCKTARADESEDKRPNAALAACASGDVAKGISILGELYAETRNPAFVFNQGRCYQKNNQLEPARSSFTEYIRIGTSEPPEDIKRAEGFIKEIDEALAARRKNEPAPVLVTTTQQSGEGHAHMLRVTSIALAAVGVAAVGAGVFFSLKVKSMNDAINQEFAGQDYVTDPVHLQQQIADGKSYETWQWVGYGVGIAALAGAATTFLLGGGFAGSGSAAAEHAAVTVTPALSPDGAGGLVRIRF